MGIATVLGAGMVGSVIAADLASQGFSVTVADRSEDNLAKAVARAAGRLRAVRADLSDASAIRNLVSGSDVVVGALSSRLGFAALGAVIDAGKNYCDISFMAEDFQDLDARARERGVTVVTDCGVAPGMSHILSAHGAGVAGRLPRDRDLRWRPAPRTPVAL
jgi:lysine 6-dehydrogenase